MFRLGLQVLEALQQGTVLVVDELESSLHPLLAIELLKLFLTPNPTHSAASFYLRPMTQTCLGRSPVLHHFDVTKSTLPRKAQRVCRACIR